MLPWSIAFNDRLYKIRTRTGGVLTEISPDERAELRRRRIGRGGSRGAPCTSHNASAVSG